MPSLRYALWAAPAALAVGAAFAVAGEPIGDDSAETPASVSRPRPARRPAASAPAARPPLVPPELERIAACKSGGDPRVIGGAGAHRGKYQFTRETWAALGGNGDPAAASEAEQDRRALVLYRRSGAAGWPGCSG